MNTQSPIASIKDRFSRWWRQSREYSELSTLDDRHFQDMGVCRSDLASVVSGATDVDDRIRAMAEKLGVSYEKVMEEHWRAIDVVRSCATCGERRVCRHWLDGTNDWRTPGDFCPNAATFESLKKKT